MALAKKIEVLLTAGTAQFEGAFRKSGTTLDRFRGKSDKTRASLAAWAISAVGIYAVVRAFTALGRAAEGVNKALARSVAIMGNVDKLTQGQMVGKAYEATYGTSFGAEDATRAYYYLASAGMDVQQSMAALGQVVQFAQAGMFDLSRATDLATDAQSAMGLKVKDAQTNLANLTRVTDVLIGANTLGNATTEQFSEALSNKAAAAARLAGKSIEEVTAMLVVFADQGQKGADAGTRVDMVLRDLQEKALLNVAAFKKYGVAVYDADLKMRHIADIIEDLEKAMAGYEAGQKTRMLLEMGFTARASASMKMLLGYSEAMREHHAKLDKMNGITREVAEKSLPEFTKATTKIWQVLKAIVVIPVSAFLETIGIGLNTIITLIEKAFGWIKKLLEKVWGVERATNAHAEAMRKQEEATKAAADAQAKMQKRLEESRKAYQNMQEALASFARQQTALDIAHDTEPMVENYKRLKEELERMTQEQRYAAQGLKGWLAEWTKLQELQTPGFMMQDIKERILEAEKWRAKAETRAKAEERQAALKELGEDLRREFDPVGEAIKRIGEIKAALAEGFVSPEIVGKAFKAIREQFADRIQTVEIGRAGWAERGSAAAFSQTLPKESIDIGKQQLAELRAIEAEIRKANRDAPRLRTGRAA